MSPAEWKEFTELIKVIDPLAWPIVAIVVASTLRKPFQEWARGTTPKRVSGQVAGVKGEVEFEQRIDQAEQEVAAGATETESRARLAGAKAALEDEQEKVKSDADEVETVLRVNPQAALALVAAKIESELRALARAAELRAGHRHLSALRTAAELEEQGVLPRGLNAALRDLWPIRNQLVHGQNVAAETVVRSVNLGLDILANLEKIERLEQMNGAIRAIDAPDDGVLPGARGGAD